MSRDIRERAGSLDIGPSTHLGYLPSYNLPLRSAINVSQVNLNNAVWIRTRSKNRKMDPYHPTLFLHRGNRTIRVQNVRLDSTHPTRFLALGSGESETF